jgi:hypothetical protein
LGIDPTPVHPPTIRPTVSEEVTLPRDENDNRKLLGTLYGLVERCSQRLRRRGLLPARAGLVFRYADQMEVIRQINLSHLSFWDCDLYAPLEKLFLKACQRRTGIRFMRVWFRNLSTPTSQLSLFPTVSPVEKKKALVAKALDQIREKHGETSIRYGRLA